MPATMSPEDLQTNLENTVKLLESEDTDNIFQVALVLGEPGSGKSQWIKKILDTLLRQDPNRAIYIVGPTVDQYSDIAYNYGEIPIVTRLKSLTPHLDIMRAVTDSICIYDDLDKEDMKAATQLMETARNSRNTVYNLVHHLESINNAAFSIYNLFIIFKTAHALVFNRLYKQVLSDYGRKRDIEMFYNMIKKKQYYKFVLNRSQPNLPYFLLSGTDDMHVDPASEYQG
jgi:Cdc6-like AAA superfamily ATPase